MATDQFGQVKLSSEVTDRFFLVTLDADHIESEREMLYLHLLKSHVAFHY